MSHIETSRLGDRLSQLGGIADFLRGLDPAKINEIVTQLTAFLKVLLGLFGQPPATSSAPSALSADEQQAIGAIFTPEQVVANAIDLGAIMALVQLIMQLFSMFKKPAA